MAKVIIKSEKITPFGGIYYASKAFYTLSLDKVINGTLGVRSSTYNGCTFARGFRPCFRQDGKSRCDVFVQASLRLFPWHRLNRQYHCVHRKQYGNTPVKFHQADTLSRAFKLLHSYGLHIGTRRMKLLDSNEIRQLRDVCIFEVNGIEVYM